MTWFDAGVNLLDSRFKPEEVIQQGNDAGVDKLCVITTSPREWEQAVQLHTRFPEHIVYTLGIHPHNAKSAVDGNWSLLENAVDAPGFVAVGECGLDFNRNFSSPESQINAFKQQLQIAKTNNLPLYLHQRDAFKEQIACIHEIYGKTPVKGIAHCFTGNIEQMQTYLDMGLYIGITGWLSDPKRGHTLREAVAHLPQNRLIFETDAPYLFPKHVRPRKSNNSPVYLPDIAAYFAEITHQELCTLQQISYTNTLTLFEM